MKISQCTALVAIADAGSFTLAAKALSVSQSAVSHAVSSLEKSLGVALMSRSRSGIEFTDVGERVLQHARTVVHGAEQIRQEARAVREHRSGTLRVGTSQSFAGRLLPRLLSEFRAAWPGIGIELREGTDQEIAEWLGGYAVDVGVVALPKERLNTVPLLQDEVYAVLPQDHPLAGRGELSVTDLADELFVMPVSGVETLLRAAFRTAGLTPRIGYRAHDVNSLLSMVAEGLGITVVPALALPSAPIHPHLRVLPFAPSLTRSVGIGVRTGARHVPAVEAFVATARKLAREDTWNRPAVRTPGAGPGGPAEAAAPQTPWRRSGSAGTPAGPGARGAGSSACSAMASAS
ncbi:LysR family transcriptional regulator [Streptomyces sp. NPDC088745]|uniref:LysR family transcriptional regulator n=1 Tax=Streptomyces sp. NPDC088745 TaxID=3365884 RepID=UPI00380ADBC3